MGRKKKIPGLSFSWKRALGITSAKRKIARATGIPTTQSGRKRKAGALMGCLIPVLITLLIILLSAFAPGTQITRTRTAMPTATATPKIYSTEIVNPQGTVVVQCLIKGNINSKKEKIYHMPDQRDYEKTIIDTSKGERWFCTEEEALEAGWRKAKR
jgi:hypothetical protein